MHGYVGKGQLNRFLLFKRFRRVPRASRQATRTQRELQSGPRATRTIVSFPAEPLAFPQHRNEPTADLFRKALQMRSRNIACARSISSMVCRHSAQLLTCGANLDVAIWVKIATCPKR